MLQEANDLEEGISKRQYELAKREYELQVAKNAQSATSQEDMKKENDLKIAMITAETNLFNKRKELNKQMATLRLQEQEEIRKAAEERNRITREAGIQHMQDMLLIAQAEEATLQAQAEALAEQSRALLDALNEDEEEEDIPTPEQQALNLFGLDSEGVAYFRELLDKGVSFSQAKTQAIADQTKRMTQSFATSFGQLGNAFSQMGDMLGEFAEENEDAANASKAFSLIGILTSQAQSIAQGALAISEGVASAASIPFPGNIPAILSIVAQITGLMVGVATSITQAKSILTEANAQHFATGGIVGGNSYTGDRVPIMANSREMVLNTDQQTRLFNALNGQNDSGFGINYEAMAAAVAALPAPVMDYSEFTQFQDNVSQYEEIAKV